MKRKKMSLRARATVFFILLGILPCMLLTIEFYDLFRDLARESVYSEITSNLAYIMNAVEQQLDYARDAAGFYTLNRELDDLLTMDYQETSSQQRELISFLQQAEANSARLQVGSDIVKVLIHGFNGVNIQFGNQGSKLEIEAVEKSALWNTEDPLSQEFQFGNASEIDRYYQGYIYAYSRNVTHTLTGQQIGKVVVVFSSQIVNRFLQNYQVEEGEEIFIVNDAGQCLASTLPENMGTDYNEIKMLDDLPGNGTGEYTTQIDGKEYSCYYTTGKATGWRIVRQSSRQTYYRLLDRFEFSVFSILGIMILACVLISFALSRTLNRPIVRLSRKIDNIAAGDFTRDPTIEGEDELGTVGKGLNHMSGQISTLMEKAVQDEKTRQELEFKMLQNQINPHFLYNSLNCIKIMADMQDASAIGEAIEALENLFRETAKGTDDEIPLYEELGIVEDYVSIQNLRYNGILTLCHHCEDQALMECRILKFTLQPIVENAINHGIIPARRNGTVQVSIRAADANSVEICVEDDGLGMKPERIQQVMQEQGEKRKEAFNSIGIRNVQERIQLSYGEEYGLKMESKPGEYTRVLIRIPRKE